MPTDPRDLVWPPDRLDAGLAALARRSGATPSGRPPPGPPAAGDDLRGWLAAAAAAAGMDASPADVVHGELEGLARSGPAAIILPDMTGALLLLPGGWRRAWVLGPDGRAHPVAPAAVASLLRASHDAALAPEVTRLMDIAGIAPGRRGAVGAALLAERAARLPVDGCFLLRPPPGAPFARQLALAGVPGQVGLFILGYAAQSAILVAAWAVLGGGVFAGGLDPGALAGWAALLLALVPFQILAMWSLVEIGVRTGRLLKLRLLQGALRESPDATRSRGVGQLLGATIESESLEGQLFEGGPLAPVSAVELTVAMVVLAAGAAGGTLALALGLWAAATLALGAAHLRRRRAWTRARLQLTHDLVERLVGYRTRLAQEPRLAWHAEEDADLARYVGESAAVDRAATALLALPARSWLIVALGVLGWSAYAGASPVALAISVGGVVLAYGALRRLSGGCWLLSGALLSWEAIARPFRLAAAPDPTPAAAAGHLDGAFLTAGGLRYRYRPDQPPVIDGCDLTLGPGDQVLLEGPSGGGKSTLAALLAGLRRPDGGALVWGAKVVAAPQFHENHVFTGTLAFNLLMGRGWPASDADLDAAEAVCVELGLGELLARMPAGIHQQVGEGGWQLSHGERSRLYIARALLQGAEVVILDESLAALDPATARAVLSCLFARAPSLLVVAHP